MKAFNRAQSVVLSIAGILCLCTSGFAESLISIGKPVPTIIPKAIAMGHATPYQVLHLAISLKPRDIAGLQAYADSVSDPSNTNYRNFITPTEVGQRFGATAADVSNVVSYLKSNGFQIKLVAENHFNIIAEAYVSQAEKAFGVTISRFHAVEADAPGYLDFVSNTSKLKMPSSVAANIVDISGVDTFTKAKPRILTPTQTRVLYNTAPIYNKGLNGFGRTLAISSWDGFRLTNVPLYYKQYNLPTPAGGVGSNVTVIPLAGGSGAGTPQGEADLDIQMVLGMAPLCKFLIYDGGPGALINVLTQEANDNSADVISESYGWNIDGATATAAHALRVQMTAQGITYMVATGDFGTNLEPFSYPNYEPEPLMVGGTIAKTDSSGKRLSEVGWDGSGGGWVTGKAVTFNTLPSWQKGPGVPTGINFRLNPDVALHAADSDGAYYFFLGGTLTNGFDGTSFACPVFCGALGVAELQAIANGSLTADKNGKKRLGRIQDLVYGQQGRSDIYFDVTQGSNGTLPNGNTSTATKGWDFVTGWGPVDFNAFAASIRRTISEAETTTAVDFYIGTSPNGTVGDVQTLDGRTYSVTSVKSPAGQVAGAVSTITLKSSLASVVGVSVKLVVSGTKSATNYLYLYNFKTAAYDLVTAINMTGGFDTVMFSLPNLTSYVSGNTIKVLDRALMPTRLSGASFRLGLDYVAATAQVSVG